MKKKRVLITDDEKEFLFIAKLNLEKTGHYEVLTLSEATDIVAQVNRFKPDVIILDLLMPSVGGIEACTMLNDDPACSKIPIIILSALVKDLDRLKAYKTGATEYLAKPIKKDDLIAKIEKVLSAKKIK